MDGRFMWLVGVVSLGVSLESMLVSARTEFIMRRIAVYIGVNNVFTPGLEAVSM